MTPSTKGPTALRVEHLADDDTLGLDVRAPRLSWRLPEGTRRQRAYRILAGAWDSGVVDSDQSVLVPYRGDRLVSRERVEWRVKVWTEAGESEWSEPASWEMGLLRPPDWTARWVGPANQASRDQVWALRSFVTVDAPVRRARLYATAYGIYEATINGTRVGDLELTPGFTSYHSTLQVQTFDVTDHLAVGPNEIVVTLSGGWVRWANRYRHEPLGLLAQLEIATESSTGRHVTGPDWEVAPIPDRTADLMAGETVDLHAQVDGWSPVHVQDRPLGLLVRSPAPPVRRIEEIAPVRIGRPRPGVQVVDFGQNINGWVRVDRPGPSGTRLTLNHGEALDHEGDVTVEHIMPRDVAAFQRDVITSDAASSFEPRHSTKGFRYVRVDGHADDSDADLTAVVVHTDLPRTGWFECSDERINRLHDAAVWSFRSNACDIPTDCPTRERMGWTADWYIFYDAAAFLYDVAGFTTKWLRDLAADQESDGLVWHCAPNTEYAEFYRDFPPGSAGWGDAAVIVPWKLYRHFADPSILEAQWESMVAWVEFAARRAREGRHPRRMMARPIAAAHEEFLWDTGFHWGEWLEPGHAHSSIPGMLAELRERDHGSVATAFLHHSSGLLARCAAVLGREADVERYSSLAAKSLEAWRMEYLTTTGTLIAPTQAECVRALAFDLVPDDARRAVAQQLRDLIREADTHLATGFLSTGLLLPTLADHGCLDLAYDLLFQDTEPSWLAMIDRGATTVWELWDGIDADGRPHESLNHYSKGAVISFLHRYTAGIELLEPGYRRFRIAPRPGGDITWCRAAHESPYGRIEVEWRIENGILELEATVPPGSTAEIVLTDGRVVEAGPGTMRAHGRVKGARDEAYR